MVGAGVFPFLIYSLFFRETHSLVFRGYFMMHWFWGLVLSYFMTCSKAFVPSLAQMAVSFVLWCLVFLSELTDILWLVNLYIPPRYPHPRNKGFIRPY